MNRIFLDSAMIHIKYYTKAKYEEWVNIIKDKVMIRIKYNTIWARLNMHVLSIQHNYKQTTNNFSY